MDSGDAILAQLDTNRLNTLQSPTNALSSVTVYGTSSLRMVSAEWFATSVFKSLIIGSRRYISLEERAPFFSLSSTPASFRTRNTDFDKFDIVFWSLWKYSYIVRPFKGVLTFDLSYCYAYDALERSWCVIKTKLYYHKLLQAMMRGKTYLRSFFFVNFNWPIVTAGLQLREYLWFPYWIFVLIHFSQGI